MEDIQVLVSIARVDGDLARFKNDLERIPSGLEELNRKLDEVLARGQSSADALDALRKEHRSLETGLQDNEAKIVESKNKLAVVKTNQEYTAALKEIETIETDSSNKETRILELFDLIETRTTEDAEVQQHVKHDADELRSTIAALEQKRSDTEAAVARLTAEKPRYLDELSPQMLKRYDRLHDKLGGVAVTNVPGDTCGGCGRRVPPQTAVEVRKNEAIISCEGCGRILVHFETGETGETGETRETAEPGEPSKVREANDGGEPGASAS